MVVVVVVVVVVVIGQRVLSFVQLSSNRSVYLVAIEQEETREVEEVEEEKDVVLLLLASNIFVYLRNGSAQMFVLAATMS